MHHPIPSTSAPALRAVEPAPHVEHCTVDAESLCWAVGQTLGVRHDLIAALARSGLVTETTRPLAIVRLLLDVEDADRIRWAA